MTLRRTSHLISEDLLNTDTYHTASPKPWNEDDVEYVLNQRAKDSYTHLPEYAGTDACTLIAVCQSHALRFRERHLGAAAEARGRVAK